MIEKMTESIGDAVLAVILGGGRGSRDLPERAGREAVREDNCLCGRDTDGRARRSTGVLSRPGLDGWQGWAAVRLLHESYLDTIGGWAAADARHDGGTLRARRDNGIAGVSALTGMFLWKRSDMSLTIFSIVTDESGVPWASELRSWLIAGV